MTRPLKVLAFGASNNTQSINKRLALHAGEVLRAGTDRAIELHTLDLNDFDMPVFSPAREKEGVPQLAHDFYNALGEADGTIISLAEYNGSYTAAFKNVFDWASRIKMRVFQDKPTLLLATSIGKGGGKNVMKSAREGLPFFGANVTSSFLFGPFGEHFGDDGLNTPELRDELRNAVKTFEQALPGTTD